MALQFSLFSPRIHSGPLIRYSWTSIFARKFATSQESSNVDTIVAPPPPKLKVSNPFALFIQDHSIEFSRTDSKSLFKFASEKWHTLNEYQKNEYFQKAQQNKNESMDLMREYKTKYTEEQRTKYILLKALAKRVKKNRAIAEANEGKARKLNRRITGYNLFTQEFAKGFDSAGKKGLEYLAALASAVSESWRNLNSSEKEAFNKRAHEIKNGRMM